MSRTDRYRVLLIRSGATEWDERAYLPGVADLPLCDRERDTFCIDGDFVVPGQVCGVLSAGDEASVQTAGLAADALKCKAKKCTGLGDVDLGLWQGLRIDELKERTPKVYRQWMEDPLSLNPPEGESLREARDRLIEQLIKAVEKTAKGVKNGVPTVAVVLRPIALALVRSRLLGDSRLAGWTACGDAPRFEWHELSETRLDTLRVLPAASA
jgi:broad specificity phosphatase PhoE